MSTWKRPNANCIQCGPLISSSVLGNKIWPWRRALGFWPGKQVFLLTILLVGTRANWPYIQKDLTSMALTSGLHCILIKSNYPWFNPYLIIVQSLPFPTMILWKTKTRKYYKDLCVRGKQAAKFFPLGNELQCNELIVVFPVSSRVTLMSSARSCGWRKSASLQPANLLPQFQASEITCRLGIERENFHI